MSRYFIENLHINGSLVGPNMNPNDYLPSNCNEVYVSFYPDQNKIQISCDEHLDSTKVKLIRNKDLSPTDDNKTIALACLSGIYTCDNKNFKLMAIMRSKNLRSFPNKISFPGGLYDPSDKSLTDTAFREISEEMCLDSYIDQETLSRFKEKLELSHMMLSHPTVGSSRRFNIVFVYSLKLSKEDYSLIDVSKFQVEEVDGIIDYNLELLIDSFKISPSNSDSGWTPNGCLIVLDYLKDYFKTIGDPRFEKLSACNIHSSEPKNIIDCINNLF
jgi:8-oxo-dGTP pyrophosphatase MutT (NUDIX family)